MLGLASTSMCGRFVSASPPDEIARYFEAAEPSITSEQALEARYNVAPTDDVLVVRADDAGRRVEAYHWGLVPFWAKDPKVGNRMINARAETVATNGAFKHAFLRRRCLVPADGFYEWDKIAGSKVKQPYFVHRPDDEPYAFAGLWEEWGRTDDDPGLRSTTIITTTPNDVMARIHDRMPVILPAAAWAEWLDPSAQDAERLLRLLVPAPSSVTVLRPVSTEVINVRHDGPQLLDEVAVPVTVGAAGDEPTLFDS